MAQWSLSNKTNISKEEAEEKQKLKKKSSVAESFSETFLVNGNKGFKKTKYKVVPEMTKREHIF